MIHLVAFGFMRGDLDRVNRTKRFSFCRVYPKSQAGLVLALNVLARIAEDWDGTAEFADSLIEEIPVMRKDPDFEDFKGKEKHSENVRFDRVRFFQWLDKPAGKPISPVYASAFRAGKMLKYFRSEIFPVPMGAKIEEGDDDLPGRNVKKENKPGKLSIILAVLCVVLGIGCAILGGWGLKLKTDLQTAQKNVSELRSEISGLKKILPDKNIESLNQPSMDIQPSAIVGDNK